MIFLENDNLRLRALEPEDLDILYRWENNTQLWLHGNTLSPYSKLALREYISETQNQDIYQAKQLRLMIITKKEDKVVGTVDLYDFDPHNNKVGIGILIDEKYQGKSYATQTLKIIEEYVFLFLRINQLYAYIAVDNTKSILTFEKSGYKISGTLNDWICCNSIYKNVNIYQLLNNKTIQK